MKDSDKRALLDNSATIKTKIEILPLTQGEESIILNEDLGIVNWDYEDFRYVKDEGIIGQFVARELDGTLSGLTDEFNLTNRELNLKLCVKTNTTENWYDLGNFLVTKADYDDVKDTVSFKSMDYTKKFNKAYEDTITYPCTLLQLAQNVCEQCGCELGNTDFKHANDWIITGNVFVNGETCRDVMKAIGKLAYSWVRIDWDNKVYLDFNRQTQVTSEYNKASNNSYYNLKTQKEKFGAVNRVVIGYKDIEGERTKVENDIDIQNNGVHEITIFDNPLVYNQELREKAIIGAEELLGLEYMPLEMTTIGHPWLKGNELMEVHDMQGNILYTYPFDRTINYFGHIKTKISSDAKTSLDNTYAYEPELERRVGRTEIIVDKQNKTIQAIVSDVSENSDKIAQLKIDTDSILQQVSHKIDSSSTAKNTNYLHVTDNYADYPISFRIIGDLHTLYPQEDLYPSDDLYPDDASYSEENEQYKYVYLSIDKSETETEDKVRLALPLNYLNIFDDVYDEFLVDKNYCTIIRRVGINDDGSKYKLDEEVIEDRGELTIPLFDNENYIYLENYKTDGLIFSMDYMIHNEYTDEFATKSEVTASINVKADSILQEVSKKYTTIEQTNEVEKDLKAQIESTASSIKSEVSGTYITKTDSATNISTAKTEAIVSANSSTDTKLKNYSTTTEMDASIEQKISASEASINLELKKKVNGSDYTGANIIAKINGDTSEAGINADKITLTAEDILNLIAGNSINLSSKNITIESDNFSVNKNGKVIANDLTVNNGTITGGTINSTTINGSRIIVEDANSNNPYISIDENNGEYHLNIFPSLIAIIHENFHTQFYDEGLYIYNSSNNKETRVKSEEIITPKVISGNIDCGEDYCSSSGYSLISFNKTFETVPKVVATPVTSTNGVIALKIRNITTTGFEITIGGSNFSSELFNWIAIS